MAMYGGIGEAGLLNDCMHHFTIWADYGELYAMNDEPCVQSTVREMCYAVLSYLGLITTATTRVGTTTSALTQDKLKVVSRRRDN